MRTLTFLRASPGPSGLRISQPPSRSRSLPQSRGYSSLRPLLTLTHHHHHHHHQTAKRPTPLHHPTHPPHLHRLSSPPTPRLFRPAPDRDNHRGLPVGPDGAAPPVGHPLGRDDPALRAGHQPGDAAAGGGVRAAGGGAAGAGDGAGDCADTSGRAGAAGGHDAGG